MRIKQNEYSLDLRDARELCKLYCEYSGRLAPFVADYRFISQDHWTQFVAYRSSPSFLTMRKVQQMKHQRNMYPHRLSRKGYAGLEEQLLRAENLSDDEELESFFCGLKQGRGRMAVSRMMQQRTKLRRYQLKEKVYSGEESISGSLYVLEKALGTKEHGGRVRGVGGCITPSAYFCWIFVEQKDL
ncbi:hypothetical protein OROMI_012058 [Orobanche minor]